MFHFGGGGFPGGMGGRSQGPPADTTKLYSLLNVEKDATAAQIKKAYRRMAMKHHPDKGGDAETFKKMTHAYEILSDPEKRELYDEGGEEAVENGGSGNGMADIFDLFGGGGGSRRGGRSQKRKGEDVVFPLKVTLADLYKGSTKKLRLTKNILCDACDGKGGKGVTTCRDCKGQGVRVILRQVGPGMIQQMRTQCNNCDGTGQCIAEKNKCKKCHGKKTVKEKKTLEVSVLQGMSHSQRIVFSGEADEAPNTIPGDVVVVLQQLEHNKFKRDGNHLFMKKNITLSEALCGFQFTIDHLDGRQLICKSTPGKIYRPGDFKAIWEEGMPLHKSPMQNGNLYIEFSIDFPKSGALDDKTKEVLLSILPKPDKPMTPAGAEVEDVELVDVDMKAERAKFEQQQRESRAYDDDDDDDDGRRGQAQCQSQ